MLARRMHWETEVFVWRCFRDAAYNSVTLHSSEEDWHGTANRSKTSLRWLA